MQLEFYCVNHDFNGRQIEMFNIFRNSIVNDRSIKEIRKYLRSPKSYKYESLRCGKLTGWDAFVAHILLIIRCEERWRCEYEIMAGGLFDKPEEFQKIDCAWQAEANIQTICYDIIRQYKEHKKNERAKKDQATEQEIDQEISLVEASRHLDWKTSQRL